MYVVRGGNGLVSYVIPPATHRITGVAGVMVSIVAFQAVDPGSIPGERIFWFPFKFRFPLSIVLVSVSFPSFTCTQRSL